MYRSCSSQLGQQSQMTHYFFYSFWGLKKNWPCICFLSRDIKCHQFSVAAEHQPACYIPWLQIGVRACLLASYISVHHKWLCVFGLKYQTYLRTQALHSQIADCYRVVSGLGMRLAKQGLGMRLPAPVHTKDSPQVLHCRHRAWNVSPLNL